MTTTLIIIGVLLTIAVLGIGWSAADSAFERRKRREAMEHAAEAGHQQRLAGLLGRKG